MPEPAAQNLFRFVSLRVPDDTPDGGEIISIDDVAGTTELDASLRAAGVTESEPNEEVRKLISEYTPAKRDEIEATSFSRLARLVYPLTSNSYDKLVALFVGPAAGAAAAEARAMAAVADAEEVPDNSELAAIAAAAAEQLAIAERATVGAGDAESGAEESLPDIENARTELIEDTDTSADRNHRGQLEHLTDTWIVLQLRRRLDRLDGSNDTEYSNEIPDVEQTIVLLENSLRVARVIQLLTASERNELSRATADSLLRAPITLPRSWRNDSPRLRSKLRSLHADGVIPRVRNETTETNNTSRAQGISETSENQDSDLTEQGKTTFALVKERFESNRRQLRILRQMELKFIDMAVELSRRQLRQQLGNQRTNAPNSFALRDRVIERSNDEERAVLQALYGDNMAIPRQLEVATIQAQLEAMIEETVQQANADCAVLDGLAEVNTEISVLNPPTVQLAGTPPPSLRILGFGELMLTRQRLNRHEATEIAHIENVLAGETRRRTHTRGRTTETLIDIETFTSREEERDLQTSERFDMQSETAQTINEQFRLQAGLNVTGSYGTAQFESSLGLSLTRGKTQSDRQATNIAQEVTNRTVERLQESVRERRLTRLVERVEEENLHQMEGGESSYSGIYRWVEKVYDVELRQYGTRFMVEFYVPEPGAYLMQRDNDRPPLPPPPLFDVSPTDILEENYLCYVRRFRAFDVEPPPPLLATLGYAWKGDKEDPGPPRNEGVGSTEANHTLQVPPGYAPYAVHVSVTGGYWRDEIDVAVTVGSTPVVDGRFSDRADMLSWWKLLNPVVELGESGLPIFIRVNYYGDSLPACVINVYCLRTNRGFQEWQLRTYQQLRQGYERLVSEYEEALLTAQFAGGGIPVGASNPDLNRAREKEELKKTAIEILRERPFEFSAVQETPDGPVVDWLQADRDRDIVEFYEQAFEWKQMVYFLRPYFWGRRDLWPDRDRIESNDPLHLEFLRAGSARVIVPVTPGFERMVLHYLETEGDEASKIWYIDDSDLGDDGQFAVATSLAPEVWQSVIVAERSDFTIGTGTLSVLAGERMVTINRDSLWRASGLDIGRELYIESQLYTVTNWIDERTIELDRGYEGQDERNARYVAGSVPIGGTWEARVPTTLVVLADEVDKLNLAG